MSKYIQEIPIDLLKELAAQIRHQDFQPKLVENVTDGRIEAKDVIEQLDLQLIADGSSVNDQHPYRQKMSQLYISHRDEVELLVQGFMPDRGINNKDKHNRVINLLNAIDKATMN